MANKAAQIIEELGKTDWGDDNESQMKAVQLLKGLALSKEDVSNKFMKSLSEASTAIANRVLNQKAKNEAIRHQASQLL